MGVAGLSSWEVLSEEVIFKQRTEKIHPVMWKYGEEHFRQMDKAPKVKIKE